MKIVQAMPTLAYGDAIGNTALALDALLRGMGLRTGIYAENIDVRLPKGTARPAAKLRTEAEDILLYHGAVTSGFVEKLAKQPGRKVPIYHNITPPRFFDPYSAKSADLCAKGLEQMRFLAGKVERCIADGKDYTDGETLNEYIATTSWDGATGVTTFDETGRMDKELLIIQIENGEHKIIKG